MNARVRRFQFSAKSPMGSDQPRCAISRERHFLKKAVLQNVLFPRENAHLRKLVLSAMTRSAICPLSDPQNSDARSAAVVKYENHGLIEFCKFQNRPGIVVKIGLAEDDAKMLILQLPIKPMQNGLLRKPLSPITTLFVTLHESDAPFSRTAHIQVDAWASPSLEVACVCAKCIISAEIMHSVT